MPPPKFGGMRTIVTGFCWFLISSREVPSPRCAYAHPVYFFIDIAVIDNGAEAEPYSLLVSPFLGMEGASGKSYDRCNPPSHHR